MPGEKNIYLCEPYCTVHKNGEFLTIQKDGKKVTDLSLTNVQNLLLYGNTQITTQAITLLMDCGTDVIFLSEGGAIRGRIQAERKNNALVRIAQYNTWLQKDIRLAIARELVYEKIRNQKEILTTFRYRKKLVHLKEKEREMNRFLSRLDECESINELMGMEGQAAAIYFSVFSDLLSEYEFRQRERRPAFDPVNALLNLTYTFLKNEVSTVLFSYSLDLELGFLHSFRGGRESLALDIMEPYRPVLADRFVLSLLNRKQLKEEDFENSPEGLRLNREAMKRYCAYFREMMYEPLSDGSCWVKRIENSVMRFRDRILKYGQDWDQDGGMN